MTKTLYAQLFEAGCELDNHYSDLYVKSCPESARILAENPDLKVSKFVSKCKCLSCERTEWYEIPFMYEPFWEEKRASEHE